MKKLILVFMMITAFGGLDAFGQGVVGWNNTVKNILIDNTFGFVDTSFIVVANESGMPVDTSDTFKIIRASYDENGTPNLRFLRTGLSYSNTFDLATFTLSKTEKNIVDLQKALNINKSEKTFLESVIAELQIE